MYIVWVCKNAIYHFYYRVFPNYNYNVSSLLKPSLKYFIMVYMVWGDDTAVNALAMQTWGSEFKCPEIHANVRWKWCLPYNSNLISQKANKINYIDNLWIWLRDSMSKVEVVSKRILAINLWIHVHTCTLDTC